MSTFLPDGAGLRAAMEVAGMTPGRLARIMVSLGDPRSRSQIDRTLQRQRSGENRVPPELLCLIEVLRMGWRPGEDRENRLPSSE